MKWGIIEMLIDRKVFEGEVKQKFFWSWKAREIGNEWQLLEKGKWWENEDKFYF